MWREEKRRVAEVARQTAEARLMAEEIRHEAAEAARLMSVEAKLEAKLDAWLKEDEEKDRKKYNRKKSRGNRKNDKGKGRCSGNKENSNTRRVGNDNNNNESDWEDERARDLRWTTKGLAGGGAAAMV